MSSTTSPQTSLATPPVAEGAPAAGTAPVARPPAASGNRKRTVLLLAAAAVVLIIGIAYGLYWALVLQYRESTDDAYVNGNIVQVTPQIGGTVIGIDADETQYVTAGHELVRLDPVDAQVALDEAEAHLAITVRAVRSLFATAAQLQAAESARRADLDSAERDLQRREHLASSGAVSGEELQHARDAVAVAQSALLAARQQLAADRARIDGTTIENNPEVRDAAAAVHTAYLNLARTRLPAPVDGYVARRDVQLGERVAPGAVLMDVVPLEQVWVEANFKELQLNAMRVGQPVTLTADLYGGAVTFHGTVVGFSAGTGASFALLPAQNATGNWIKVVQRLPVRIRLDPRELAAHPLQIGLSMRVQVATRDRSGSRLPPANQALPAYRTTVFGDADRQADSRVHAIIEANLAGSGARQQLERACHRLLLKLRLTMPQPSAGPGPDLHRELPPLQGSALVLGTIALSLGIFMNVLDTSIANVSIPAISGDLGVSPDQGTWVITSFGVANAISVPLTGWLTRRFGQVRLFVASTFLFVIASCLCGLAPTLGLLLLFRVIQGAVAGPMIPLSQSLLMSSYPRARQGTALGLWSLTSLTAPVVGPLLGGWITDNISWPWIFYINVPIGIVAGTLTWVLYRRRETPTARVPIDGVGLALLVTWVGALQVLLDKGKDLDWFSSWQIVLLAVVSAVGFVFFLIWELTEKQPIVDLTLFRGRNFTVGTVCMLFAYGVFFGSIVLLPLWLQQYMGYTATEAGIVLAPVGVLAVIVTPLVGRMMGRVDPRWVVSISFAIFAVVMFMRSHFDTGADLKTLLIPTFIQGAAMASFFVPLVSLSMSGLPAYRIPNASGLFNFARITSGSFGTSIVTTLWDRRATLHHAQLVERLRPDNPIAAGTFSALQNHGFGPQQTYGLLNRMVDIQAFMLSADEIFYASGLIFLALILLVWLARPGQDAPAEAAAAAGAH